MTLFTTSPLDSQSATVSTTTSTVFAMHVNTHTVVIFNEGAGDLLVFASATTTPFNLNTVASQCFELSSGEIFNLNVDTASDRPGGRNIHLCATTASSNATVFISQLVQNSV